MSAKAAPPAEADFLVRFAWETPLIFVGSTFIRSLKCRGGRDAAPARILHLFAGEGKLGPAWRGATPDLYHARDRRAKPPPQRRAPDGGLGTELA
jgi:hypothetical protein